MHMEIGDKVIIYDNGHWYKRGVITEIRNTKFGEKAIVHTETGSDWVGYTSHLEKVDE